MSLKEILTKSANASVKMQRVSPRKARLVADLIRYRKVTDALNILRNTYKKTSSILLKLLNSAIANATNNAGLDATKLYISKLLVNDGPTLKRFQPHARGRAFAILKRTSHFYIEVAEIGSVNDIIAEEAKEINKAKATEAKKEAKATLKSTKEVAKEPKKQEATTKKVVADKKASPKPTAKKPATTKTTSVDKKTDKPKETAKVSKPANVKKPATKKVTKKEGDK